MKLNGMMREARAIQTIIEIYHHITSHHSTPDKWNTKTGAETNK